MKDEHVMDLFAYGMLLYTGWRTFDYMRGSLTDVDYTTSMIVSLAFLLFSELGLIIWLHYGQPKATSAAQETVATGMMWIDFFGCMVVNLADLLRHNTIYQVDLSQIDIVLFIAPWILVATNVAAYLVYKTTDSAASLEREERRLAHEEHQAEIKVRQRALAEVKRRTPTYASRLAPHYEEDIRTRIEDRTYARFGKERTNQALPGTNQPLNGKAHVEDLDDWLNQATGGAGDEPGNFTSR